MSETEDDDGQLSKKDVSLFSHDLCVITGELYESASQSVSNTIKLLINELDLPLRKTADAETVRRGASRSELRRRRSMQSSSSSKRRVVRKRRRRRRVLRWRSSTSQRSQRSTIPTTSSLRGSLRLLR